MDHPFVKQCLQNITWATEKQIKKELWHVSGILSDRLNENLKFDINYQKRKHINSKAKSNKILFEDENKWILIDTREFLYYMKNNTIRPPYYHLNISTPNVVVLHELINNLEWNIVLPKN